MTQPDDGSILIVGDGDLSRRILLLLAVADYPRAIYVGARDVDRASLHANLVKFTAANLGYSPRITVVNLDLSSIDQAATVINELAPTEILMTASLQSWRRITELPAALFAELDQAQLGPWLPMHLALNFDLMRAVRQSGRQPVVINAAFPDAVGPVLSAVGLAPHVGIGNVANIVPALASAAGEMLDISPASLNVRLVAHHYFSHYVPRFGEAEGIPYHLSVEDLEGQALSVDHKDLFSRLKRGQRRLGGRDGQILTASSAVRLLTAAVSPSPRLVHAPALEGRPGGYPILASTAGFYLSLPDGMSEERALNINLDGQLRDGIESIDADGTVRFAETQMSIMRNILGYSCPEMRLNDVHEWADELALAYGRLVEVQR